jgi:hypothetical protein
MGRCRTPSDQQDGDPYRDADRTPHYPSEGISVPSVNRLFVHWSPEALALKSLIENQ